MVLSDVMSFGPLALLPLALVLGGVAIAAYAVWGSERGDTPVLSYRLSLVLAAVAAPVVASLVFLSFNDAIISALEARYGYGVHHGHVVTPLFWMGGLVVAFAGLPAFFEPMQAARRWLALGVAGVVLTFLSLGFADGEGMHGDPSVLTLSLVGVAVLLGPLVLLAVSSVRVGQRQRRSA